MKITVTQIDIKKFDTIKRGSNGQWGMVIKVEKPSFGTITTTIKPLSRYWLIRFFQKIYLKIKHRTRY